MIKRIYLDLDGVIYNFHDKAASLFEFDLKTKIKETGKHLDFSDFIDYNDYSKKIDDVGTSFWANLELLPWAKELFNYCMDYTDGETYFLSSTACHLYSPNGKKLAVNRDFGRDFCADHLILCRQKQLLANDYSLLVDDTKSKILSFKAAGGLGYFWPRQYLDGDFLNDFKKFTSILREKFKQK